MQDKRSHAARARYPVNRTCLGGRYRSVQWYRPSFARGGIFTPAYVFNLKK